MVLLWYKKVCTYLQVTPWDIEMDGILYSILDIDPIALDNVTLSGYQIQSRRFSTILVNMLEEANLEDAKHLLKSTIELCDSVCLLKAIKEYLTPITTTDILKCLKEIDPCKHKNSEYIHANKAILENLWNRIKSLGYTSLKDLRVPAL